MRGRPSPHVILSEPNVREASEGSRAIARDPTGRRRTIRTPRTTWAARACAGVAVAIVLLLAPPAGAQVEIEGPRAGWKSGSLVDQSDALAVAYPPNLIDRGAQR